MKSDKFEELLGDLIQVILATRSGLTEQYEKEIRNELRDRTSHLEVTARPVCS
ncbi:MAG: hypothetical protein WD315_06990 [Balneolaceae bacterium]